MNYKIYKNGTFTFICDEYDKILVFRNLKEEIVI